MKKNLNRKSVESGKPRRLTLSRETIQTLADPSLLALAQGGTEVETFNPGSGTTTEGTGCP